MSLFPVTIDGTTYTCPELASLLGLPACRVRAAVQEFHPATMDALRSAIRCQLSRPRQKHAPGHGSKLWNGYGMDNQRIAKR